MRKVLTSLSLLFLVFRLAADSADDYFHRGAQFYIFGDKGKALREINVGLARFPKDPRLQRMAKLLERENQQQPSGGQQNQEPQQKKQDQPGQGPTPTPPPDSKNPDAKPPPPSTPGQMTVQQAEQMLDAQKGDERVMIFLAPPPTNRTSRPFKDW